MTTKMTTKIKIRGEKTMTTKIKSILAEEGLVSSRTSAKKTDAAKPGDIFMPSFKRGFIPMGALFYKVTSPYKRGEGFEVQPLQAIEVPGEAGRHTLEPGGPLPGAGGKKFFAGVTKYNELHLTFGSGSLKYRGGVERFSGDDKAWSIALRKKYVVPLDVPQEDPRVEAWITELKKLASAWMSLQGDASAGQVMDVNSTLLRSGLTREGLMKLH